MKTRRLILLPPLLGVVALAAAAPVAATSFTLSYAAGTTAFNGVFALAATSTAGVYQIVAVTGAYDGKAITLVGPQSFPGTEPTSSNDNLIYSANPFLDFNGFSFLAGGRSYNVYWDSHQTYNQCSAPVGNLCENASRAVLQQVSGALLSSVPEPASWAMLIGGFGLIGTALRRVRRRHATVRFEE